MKRRDTVRTLFASVLFGALLLPATVRAQNYVVVGQVMPDFTLPAWQGGEWSPAGGGLPGAFHPADDDGAPGEIGTGS